MFLSCKWSDFLFFFFFFSLDRLAHKLTDGQIQLLNPTLHICVHRVKVLIPGSQQFPETCYVSGMHNLTHYCKLLGTISYYNARLLLKTWSPLRHNSLLAC